MEENLLISETLDHHQERLDQMQENRVMIKEDLRGHLARLDTYTQQRDTLREDYRLMLDTNQEVRLIDQLLSIRS